MWSIGAAGWSFVVVIKWDVYSVVHAPSMNPAELNYQPVSTFDGSERPPGRCRSEFSRMEKGKTYRQFLAGVLGTFTRI